MIESRKEKYSLMYIFVHRGDAVSGHYWGYGRNSESWYKFDINTKQIKEDEILLDLYKSGGTPYALVYVK
jgi:ubiquitin C-terminal hydrolase